MDSLASRLAVALGDRPVCSVFLGDDQRRELRRIAGSRLVVDAGLVELARRNPEALARLKASVVLDADLGLSAEEISERTGGALSAEEVDRLVAGWTHGVEFAQQRLAEDVEPSAVHFLTATMKDVLAALMARNARDRASAIPKAEVAKKAGLSSPCARNFRDAMSRLGREGLTDRACGQNGGIWITPKGIAAVMR